MNAERVVVDFDRHTFTRVANEIIHDTKVIEKPIDKLVYIVLCSYANNSSMKAFPRVSSIAERARCSENTARAALRRLQDVGLIEIVHRAKEVGGQTSNEYVLLEPPKSFYE